MNEPTLGVFSINGRKVEFELRHNDKTGYHDVDFWYGAEGRKFHAELRHKDALSSKPDQKKLHFLIKKIINRHYDSRY